MTQANGKERGKKWLVGGALGAAFTASLCCIGPAIFIALGFGSFAAAGTFETLRPWFALLAVVSLSFAWHQALRKKTCPNRSCDFPNKSSRGQITLLSLASALAIAVLAYPNLANLILKTSEDSARATRPNESELRVSIPSMDCAACAVGIQGKLNKLEGINHAQVRYETKQAVIIYDSHKVTERESRK